MQYVIQSIYRENLPNAWGVWRLPAGKRSVFGCRALAVFETEAEAKAFLANQR